GRQYYGDAGDLIIYFGPKNDYGQTVTAIDSMRVDASNDWVNFSGLAGKTADQGTIGTFANAAGANEVDVTGFNVGIKPLPVKTNVFVWDRTTHGNGNLGTAPNTAGASGANDDLWVYGAKVKGEAMGGWAALTLAANAGSNRSLAAFAPATAIGSANYE